MRYRVVAIALLAAGCAKANPGLTGGMDAAVDVGIDSCGDHCDHDGDGVFDQNDKCPDTPAGAVVNKVGCADSQLTPVLEANFPPYSLLWSNSGNLGRAGGLTWTYTGIQRKDLFHIYWVICDDPATPCGVSLDGPIDAPGESWLFDAADSNLPGGKLVLTNTTNIKLADNTTPQLTGRLTVNIVDGANAPLAFATVATLGVPPRSATYGAEIPGTAFTVTAIIEVKDATSAFTPFLDYYDGAPTPTAGGGTAVSFGGSFYDK